MIDRLKVASFFFLIAPGVTLVYIYLHEGGHALAGLAFGGGITEFSVNIFNFLGAHVNITGNFSRYQYAVINLSGVGVPLLTWLVLFLLLPKENSPLVYWTKLIASVGTLFTLIAWIIIPLLYLQDIAPAGDDVTKFILNSRLPPLLVTFGALALFIVGWVLFAHRFDGMRGTVQMLLASKGRPVQAWSWVLMGGMVITGLAWLGILIHSALARNSIQPPRDYILATTVDLSGRDVQEEIIAWFNLDGPGEIAVFLSISGIDTHYIYVDNGPSKWRSDPFTPWRRFLQ
jgi:hypothetical protein